MSRKSLIRLAYSLPKGSEERVKILSGIKSGLPRCGGYGVPLRLEGIENGGISGEDVAKITTQKRYDDFDKEWSSLSFPFKVERVPVKAWWNYNYAMEPSNVRKFKSIVRKWGKNKSSSELWRVWKTELEAAFSPYKVKYVGQSAINTDGVPNEEFMIVNSAIGVKITTDGSNWYASFLNYHFIDLGPALGEAPTLKKFIRWAISKEVTP